MTALVQTYGYDQGSHIRVFRFVAPWLSGYKFGAYYLGRWPGTSFSSFEMGRGDTPREAVRDLWDKLHG